MVKTKDYVISTIDEQTSYKIPNKKNSIYMKGIKQSDVDITSFKIVGDNLLFTANNKDYTISNYKGIQYIKTDNNNKTELLDIIKNNCVDNTNEIKSYNTKKLTVTGTNYNDKIDLSESGYVPTGKTNIKKNKGLTISGGNGSDKITGTDYNDIIKGGNGNDIIEGGVGADTITGGAGITVINYTKGDGNDVINLTKGEKVSLNINGVTDITDLKFEYANKNKDLRIYTDKNSTAEYLTIKNFATKDVTNNSNAKKSIIDSSSVELVVGSKTYDLRTSKNVTDNEDVVLYKTTLGENAKNFTGTWLNDDINAKDVHLYKKVKQGKKKVTVEKELKDTGLTLKGGVGNDTITGTKYSDKIYGNTGSDTINAGTGNNYIYFNKGDGHDIIENGNGIDTLVFAKKTTLSYSFDKYDLIVKYSDKDTVTLKDYFKGHSVQYVQIGTKKTAFNPPRPQIKESNKDGYHIFQGTDIDDTINGTADNDKIYSNGGIDTINGKKGNDIIYCSDEEQTLEFETGSDNDTVNLGNGTQTVKLLYDNSDGVTDVVYTKENNNLVITKTKTYNATEIETTVYRDNNGNLTLSPTTTVQNQSVVVYRDNNGDLTESSTHIENNTKVSGTYYRDSSGNITTASSSTTTKTVQHEYKYTGWYTVVSYSKYDKNGNDISGTILVLPEKLGPDKIQNSTSNGGYEEYIYIPFWDDVYWDGSSYNPNPSHTETVTVNNTRIYGNVYRDYSGNYTTSSYSNVPNTKLSGYYKDYYGNYTRQSTTILDNEIMEGTYYIDLDGDIVPEKHKTTDTITVKNYFSSDFDKTNIQFNDSESINLSEYIDDKLNETHTLTDNGGNVDITSNGGVDTLIFPENMDLTYEHNLINDDLVIRYGNSSVTLKDYFSVEHSVKNIKNGNENITINNEFNKGMKIIGLGEGETIESSIGNDYICSNGGTTTVNCDIQNFGDDTIDVKNGGHVIVDLSQYSSNDIKNSVSDGVLSIEVSTLEEEVKYIKTENYIKDKMNYNSDTDKYEYECVTGRTYQIDTTHDSWSNINNGTVTTYNIDNNNSTTYKKDFLKYVTANSYNITSQTSNIDFDKSDAGLHEYEIRRYTKEGPTYRYYVYDGTQFVFTGSGDYNAATINLYLEQYGINIESLNIFYTVTDKYSSYKKGYDSSFDYTSIPFGKHKNNYYKYETTTDSTIYKNDDNNKYYYKITDNSYSWNNSSETYVLSSTKNTIKDLDLMYSETISKIIYSNGEITEIDNYSGELDDSHKTFLNHGSIQINNINETNEAITLKLSDEEINILSNNDVIFIESENLEYIYGSSNNNLYNLNTNNKIQLIDYTGDEDILNISDNKSELSILFNTDCNGNIDINGIRILKENDFNNWFENTSIDTGIKILNSSNDNLCSVGVINTSDGYSITSSDINNLKELVASWLTDADRNYSSVDDVITNGSENDILALMTYFTENTNWQKVETP